MRILIFADHYLPGHLAGGPIRSLANFNSEFKGDHDIHLATRDRDLGGTEPYPGILPGRWATFEDLPVFYINGDSICPSLVDELIRRVKPDVIYFNSVFSRFTTSFLRLGGSGISRAIRVLLATRGELNPGALRIKPIRKAVYLRLLRRSELWRRLVFQASSAAEQACIQNYFPKAKIRVAMDIPEPAQTFSKKIDFDGRRTVIFASRICEIKNLKLALECVAELRDPKLYLEIHGPIEDENYWKSCQNSICFAKPNVSYHGPFSRDTIWNIFEKSHFMILPSLGENFSHSIYESAVSGTPFLISDRTPWTDAAQNGCGWVNNPFDKIGWRDALCEAMSLTQAEYAERSECCIQTAREFRAVAIEQHRRLFDFESND